MKKLILSLLLGIFMSVSHVCAQDVDIPVPEWPDSLVQKIQVDIDHKPLNIRFKNAVESLSEEYINRMVTTMEERNDATVETSITLGETLLTLNDLLQEEAFMQNRVIYQAKRHYDLSESEVTRALRRKQWIDAIAYIIMYALVVVAARRIEKSGSIKPGIIELDKIAVIILSGLMAIFATWFLIRPVAYLCFNRDFEIIKFLLQGT